MGLPFVPGADRYSRGTKRSLSIEPPVGALRAATRMAGKHFRSATIEEMDSARQLVQRISMQDVIIGSLQRALSDTNTVPIETLTLQFAKLSMTKSAPKTGSGTSRQSIQQP